MLNVKKLGINNIFILAIIILIIATSTCVFYTVSLDTVSAEATSDSLLNFNQLLNKDTINLSPYDFTIDNNYTLTVNNYKNNGSTSWFQIFNGSGLKNHKFYFKFNSNNGLLMFNANFGTNYLTSQVLDSGDVDNVIFYIRLGTGEASELKSTIQLIDLTQMYGAGNEPTLDKCKEIFITTYNYTENLIVDSGYMDYNSGYNNGYTAGQSDMLTSQQFFQNNLTNIGYIWSGSKIDTLNAGYNFSNNSYTYSSVEKFNKIYLKYSTDFSFNKNSVYVIKVENFSCNDFSELTIGYTLDDGSYNDLISISSDSFTYSFVNNETNGTITNFYISIELKNSDYIKSFSVKSITMYGQNDQEQIYNSAYQNGYTTGYNSAKDTYSANGEFSFMISAFNGLGEILNMQILPNVPLWVFVAIPLFFGLIAFIFKLIGS